MKTKTKRKLMLGTTALVTATAQVKAEDVRDRNSAIVKQIDRFCGGSATVGEMRRFLEKLEDREYKDVENTVLKQDYKGKKLATVEAKSYTNADGEHR